MLDGRPDQQGRRPTREQVDLVGELYLPRVDLVVGDPLHVVVRRLGSQLDGTSRGSERFRNSN